MSRIEFDLSDEAIGIVRAKAKELKVTRHVILEHMIREFAPSTEAERKEQIQQRSRAREKFCVADYAFAETEAMVRAAWTDGFTEGWSQFQFRRPGCWAVFWRQRVRSILGIAKVKGTGR